jgi:hypothetical protein
MTGGSYTVRGSRNGSQVFVTWADGQLRGDPPTVDLVQVEAELAALYPDDRQSWGHVNAFGPMGEDPLADPERSWALISSVLDTVSTVEGDVPVGALARRGRRRVRKPLIETAGGKA